MPQEPFAFGDVLAVRTAPGRIERPCFVVTNSNKVHGGGYRYDGVAPGEPVLYGKVYSEDVLCRLRTMPEAEAAALVLQERLAAGEAG